MENNLLCILKEKKTINTDYIGKTRLLNNIKIFGFIPTYYNVSLQIKIVYNDKIILDYKGFNVEIPLYNNVKVLEKDMRFPLNNTYIWELTDNDDYNNYRQGKALNINRFKNISNIEFSNDKPYYKVNKTTLVFWKNQETNIDRYAVSKGFLVVGCYIQKGEEKYTIVDPSELICNLKNIPTYNDENKIAYLQKELEEFKIKNQKLCKELADAKALTTKLEEQFKQTKEQSKIVVVYAVLMVLVIIIILMNLF